MGKKRDLSAENGTTTAGVVITNEPSKQVFLY
jgi:hypothetical protein